jgi:hypothetical protein
MPIPRRAGLSLQIFGAENAKGRITNYRTTTKDRIVAVLEQQTPVAVQLMREAMLAAYPEGGKTARSVTGETAESTAGPSVKISIANYREVKYLTTLLPDSDFRDAPYPIFPVNKSRLVFYFRKLGRWVALKSVMHPGFGRQGDVLRSAGESALIGLGRAVEYEVRSAVAEVHSGGSVFSISRRR